jgi:hypothetical protein
MVHAGLDSALPLTEYIESRYFPGLEQRIELSGANHVEPSTLKGYRDIFKNHISGFPKRPCATLIKSSGFARIAAARIIAQHASES